MLNVVICDDSAVLCEDMAKRVRACYAGTDWTKNLHIDTYNDLASIYARQAAPDILLMDINFCPDESDDQTDPEAWAADQNRPDNEGLMMGLRLTQRWPDVQLIFVSNMQQYIPDGYKYNGRDFIEKEKLDTELSKTLARITPKVQRLKNLRAHREEDAPPPHMLTFTLDETHTIQVDLYNIVYIEKIKKSRTLKLVLAKPYRDSLVHVISGNLHDVLAQLQGLPEILKVPKSFIINLYQAQKVEADRFVMKNKDIIPFNVKKHTSMRDSLYDYNDLMERRRQEWI